MKTSLKYYHGKQKLAEKIIISMIPKHRIYCEPFFSGGEVFFAKPPAEIEVINDSNREIINFFSILKTEDYARRLEQAHIDNRDALKVIKLWDTKDTFFYCNPPYFNSNLGHYKGYTEQDLKNLLQTLSEIKGKFILSSYPSEFLEKYSKKYKWNSVKIEGISLLVSLGK
ncbi:MAG: DNA adenine methylase [Bacteroidetes bacterium]|nr:DNA adenine methylase [Bacteroidota bacterium]